MAFKETVEGMSTIRRAASIIAIAVGSTWATFLALNNYRGLPGSVAAVAERVDSLDVALRSQIDSLQLSTLERNSTLRSEIGSVSERERTTRALLDDLTCVLSAQARSMDPQTECGRPLPLVPTDFSPEQP